MNILTESKAKLLYLIVIMKHEGYSEIDIANTLKDVET